MIRNQLPLVPPAWQVFATQVELKYNHISFPGPVQLESDASRVWQITYVWYRISGFCGTTYSPTGTNHSDDHFDLWANTATTNAAAIPSFPNTIISYMWPGTSQCYERGCTCALRCACARLGWGFGSCVWATHTYNKRVRCRLYHRLFKQFAFKSSYR